MKNLLFLFCVSAIIFSCKSETPKPITSKLMPPADYTEKIEVLPLELRLAQFPFSKAVKITAASVARAEMWAEQQQKARKYGCNCKDAADPNLSQDYARKEIELTAAQINTITNLIFTTKNCSSEGLINADYNKGISHIDYALFFYDTSGKKIARLYLGRNGINESALYKGKKEQKFVVFDKIPLTNYFKKLGL